MGLTIFQCVGWVKRITPPLSKICCFSVSAGWRGGLRHYPDPVAASNLQQAGEQQPHLPLQAQQPRQFTLSFHFRFLLPVFYFRLFFPLFPLSLKTFSIPLPVFPPIPTFRFIFFIVLCFRFPISGFPLPLSCFLLGPSGFQYSFHSILLSYSL